VPSSAAQQANFSPGFTIEPQCLATGAYYPEQNVPANTIHGLNSGLLPDSSVEVGTEQPTVSTHSSFTLPTKVAAGTGQDTASWLWTDGHALTEFENLSAEKIDMNMDIDGEVDWYNWVESAKVMELEHPQACMFRPT
jgi:hypothetical protein